VDNIVASALEALARDNPDTFGPELVRESARSEDSPLHPYVFDKEVGAAAESYYLDNARRLIQSVRVTIITTDETPRRVRAYAAIPGTEKPYVFVSVTTLMSDPVKLGAARIEALRRVSQAQESVNDLDALAGGRDWRVKRAKSRLGEAADALKDGHNDDDDAAASPVGV
jgi:hypothetical protein